jgi:hypothetical protein
MLRKSTCKYMVFGQKDGMCKSEYCLTESEAKEKAEIFKGSFEKVFIYRLAGTPKGFASPGKRKWKLAYATSENGQPHAPEYGAGIT